MTPTEFFDDISLADLGEVIVLSGPNYGDVYAMLDGARLALAAKGKTGVILSSRETRLLPAPLYKNCDAKIHGACPLPPTSRESISWESQVILAAGSMVVLVANQFDVGNAVENPRPKGLPVDAVVDLLNEWNVRQIILSGSRKYPGIRELFPMTGRLYYYGMDILFLKSQEQEFPLKYDDPIITGVNSNAGGHQPVGPLGPSVGKTLVSVLGDNFSSGSMAFFGGVPAIDVNVVDSRTINCLTPPHVAGVVDVMVRGVDGRAATMASAFYYY